MKSWLWTLIAALTVGGCVTAESHDDSDTEWTDTFPDVYMSMGSTAENVAQRYNVTREQLARFADIRPVGEHIGRVGRAVLNNGFFPNDLFEQFDQVINGNDLMPAKVDDLIAGMSQKEIPDEIGADESGSSGDQ